jgi:hypothetical protein
MKSPVGAVYRWALFDTLHQTDGWAMGNNSLMFGGVAPSNWTNNNYRAIHISADKEVQRTLLTNKGYGGKNAMIISQIYHQYSSDTGRVGVVLFRIQNNTASTIIWNPQFYYTCYGSWSEVAGVAVNGVEVWNSGGSDSQSSGNNMSLSITLPASRTSTIIFTVTSGRQWLLGNISIRGIMLGFYNNSLALPSGLKYVDDLDTATGNWEQ